MKAARIKKNNKIKKEEQIVRDEYSIKNMIIITLVLLVIFGIFYFITTLVAQPKAIEQEDNSYTQINLTKITLNQLLDRKEKSYYVLATMPSLYKKNISSSANYLTLYNTYIKDYKTKEDALMFYMIDLDDALNKNYVSEMQNITNDLENLKLNGEVLFKIKDKKIEETYSGSDEILKELSNLKEK